MCHWTELSRKHVSHPSDLIFGTPQIRWITDCANRCAMSLQQLLLSSGLKSVLGRPFQGKAIWSGRNGESNIRRFNMIDPPAPVLMRSCKSNRPLSMLKTLHSSQFVASEQRLGETSLKFLKRFWRNPCSHAVAWPTKNGFPPQKKSQFATNHTASPCFSYWPKKHSLALRNGLTMPNLGLWMPKKFWTRSNELNPKYEETQNDTEWQLWHLQNQRS